MKSEIPAVILAGGLGTRLREETEFRPKPMVEIGGKPILWHIMKHLSKFGIYKFIICVGYKGDVIRDYFLNYQSRNSDFTISLNNSHEATLHTKHPEEDWLVTIAETGAETNTGGRLKLVEKYINQERFICTYGDGISDVDISKLLEFHSRRNTIGTVTAVRPRGRFGMIQINENAKVMAFAEKPQSMDWINGGFFVFKKDFFPFLDNDSVLEEQPIQSLVLSEQLTAYKHDGFWQSMDTYREVKLLNEMFRKGEIF